MPERAGTLSEHGMGPVDDSTRMLAGLLEYEHYSGSTGYEPEPDLEPEVRALQARAAGWAQVGRFLEQTFGLPNTTGTYASLFSGMMHDESKDRRGSYERFPLGPEQVAWRFVAKAVLDDIPEGQRASARALIAERVKSMMEDD